MVLVASLSAGGIHWLSKLILKHYLFYHQRNLGFGWGMWGGNSAEEIMFYCFIAANSVGRMMASVIDAGPSSSQPTSWNIRFHAGHIAYGHVRALWAASGRTSIEAKFMLTKMERRIDWLLTEKFRCHWWYIQVPDKLFCSYTPLLTSFLYTHFDMVRHRHQQGTSLLFSDCEFQNGPSADCRDDGAAGPYGVLEDL